MPTALAAGLELRLHERDRLAVPLEDAEHGRQDFSSEMNETSTTASDGWSPKMRGSRARAFVCSITTTRLSVASLSSSWPVPTSTA